MQITHFSNSFIHVKTQDNIVCCDPWVGKANYGAWHSFPEFEKKDLIAFLSEVNFVYISHLHDDHLDPRFLKESGLINKIFIIKNFSNKTLFNRLKKLSAHEVIELNPFEIYFFGKTKLSILPQISSNSSNLENDINYDLDTSIIISDSDCTFFNLTDNPISINDSKYFSKWISENYGALDIACLSVGAASEYPHFFLNIDVEKERLKIISESLIKLTKKLNSFNPKIFFPAGGTYFIPGYLYAFNEDIAQPNFTEIESHLKKSNPNLIVLNLEGDKSLNFIGPKDLEIKSNPVKKTRSSLDESILFHKEDLYDYQLDSQNFTFSELSLLFDQAKENWVNYLENGKININQEITFHLFDNLPLDKKLNNIDSAAIFCSFSMPSNDKNKKGTLEIFIHKNAFYNCLVRKHVWNGILGANCLFKRTPNIYYPTDIFSLNYFALSFNQLAALAN